MAYDQHQGGDRRGDFQGVHRPLYVTLSPRPSRVALFLPLAKNMPWAPMYEMALAAQSRFWGGTANVVFPATDDIADNELFWALADRLDADYYAAASFTRRDLAAVNPEWYEEWRQKEYAAMDRDIPDAKQSARDGLLETVADEPFWRWEATEDFARKLERRLAPLRSEYSFLPWRDLRVNDARSLPEMERSLAPFSDVTMLEGWPENVANPTTDLGDFQSLLLTARFGRFPAGFANAIAEAGKATVEPHYISNRGDWANAIFGDTAEGVSFPWTVAQLGLEWYRQGAWEEDYVIVVAGDTAWDFTLFNILRRWRPATYWLPQRLARDDGYMRGLCRALDFGLRRFSADHIQVVTASDEAFQAQATAAFHGQPPWRLNARTADWRRVLPDRPYRLWESRGPGRAEPIYVHDGETVELPTPLPANATTSGPAHLRWVTDAQTHTWGSVRHGALGGELLEDPWFRPDNVRTGRSSLVYTSEGSVISGGTSLGLATVRPVLRPLTLIAQLDVALSSERWHCQASDKGAYAAEAASLFGGFRALAKGLLDPTTRAVLEAFRDSSAPGKKAADRRYLTLDDMVTVLGDIADAERICDDLTDRRVLTRGLFLKCSRCRRASWYAVSEVTTGFTCRRCRSYEYLTRERWLGTVEPDWHYDLAEVVHALLDHNGELPILAVHSLFPERDRPDEEIEVAFELEIFSPDGQKSETDIAVREGTRLWLGEATTTNQFKKAGAAEQARLERLATVAELLAARGILLASSMPFRAATRNRAKSVFDGYWPVLRIEEGVKTLPPSLIPKQLTMFKEP